MKEIKFAEEQINTPLTPGFDYEIPIEHQVYRLQKEVIELYQRIKVLEQCLKNTKTN